MMPVLISPEYADQNRQLLAGLVGFGCGGAWHAKAVATFADALYARTILDYGCGCGRLRRALWKAGWHGRVQEYDPGIPDKSDLPAKRSDLVVCVDVLEHVEPDRLSTVLAHLRSLTRRGAYLSIATRPSNKTLPDGRNAHLIVKSAEWWVKHIRGWHLQGQRRHVDKAGRRRGVTLWLTPA